MDKQKAYDKVYEWLTNLDDDVLIEMYNDTVDTDAQIRELTYDNIMYDFNDNIFEFADSVANGNWCSCLNYYNLVNDIFCADDVEDFVDLESWAKDIVDMDDDMDNDALRKLLDSFKPTTIGNTELKSIGTPLNEEDALIDLEQDMWDAFKKMAKNLGYDVDADSIDGNITAPLMDAFIKLFNDHGIEVDLT